MDKTMDRQFLEEMDRAIEVRKRALSEEKARAMARIDSALGELTAVQDRLHEHLARMEQQERPKKPHPDPLACSNPTEEEPYTTKRMLQKGLLHEN